MKFGLSCSELEFMEKVILGPLRQRGARVFLFGSRARGTHQPYSDVDLLIDADADLSAFIGGLSETLEEGNFPYKVDLVDARSLASSYLASVERDKVLL